MGHGLKHAQIIVAIPTSSFLNRHNTHLPAYRVKSTFIITMSAEFQQPAHSTRIIEPLTAAITANRSSHLVTNLSAEEPGSMGTPPPSRISSPEEASQNVVQPPNEASGGDMSLNEPGPWIPIPIGGAPTFSHLENLLRISAEGRRPFLPETDYTPFTTHSPVHLGIDQATPAWIIMHLGIIGEEKPSDKTKLGFGSVIRLHDVSLAQHNLGFESPWVFGAIQGPLRREAGFHIFPMEVHLLTLTRNPHPIPIRITHVAIPDRFLDLTGRSYPLQECTLGQRFIDGMRDHQPPLRPWEGDMMWTHPEWRVINKWLAGEKGWEFVEMLYSARHFHY